MRSDLIEEEREVTPLKLRLREIRDARGLSQKALARRAGMSQSYLAEIETGRKGIRAARLADLADALDVRISELVDDPGDPGFGLVSAAFGRLSESNRRAVMTMIEALDATDRTRGGE